MSITLADVFPKLSPAEIEMLTGPIGGSPMTWTPTTLGSGTHMSATANYRQDIVYGLVQEGYWVKATGSRVTKSGYTSESDWDYVVYDPDQKLQDVYKQIDGWVLGSDAGQGEFASIRKHDVNLILVSQEEIWKKYIIATNLINTLNSKTKEERIAVFDSVFGKDSNAKAVEF